MCVRPGTVRYVHLGADFVQVLFGVAREAVFGFIVPWVCVCRVCFMAAVYLLYRIVFMRVLYVCTQLECYGNI